MLTSFYKTSSLIAAGLVSIFLGIISSESTIHWIKSIGLLLEHLGVGFIAITILKITIEMSAEKQWVNELQAGISQKVRAVLAPLTYRITHILGEESLTALEKSFFMLDFLRPDFHLTLELKPAFQSHDLVLCDVTLEYEVRNVGDEPKIYTVEAWLDDIISPEKKVAKYTEIRIGHTPLAIPNLEKDGAIVSTGGIVRLKLPLENKIEPNNSLKVMVKGTQLMRTQDHFVWNLATVTRQMSFTIKLANTFDTQKSKIYPQPMHHMNESDFLKTPGSTIQEMTYKIDQVILPFQGVEARWDLVRI